MKISKDDIMFYLLMAAITASIYITTKNNKMEKIYYVGEFSKEDFIDYTSDEEAVSWPDYEKALDDFNNRLSAANRQLIKTPKGQKEISVDMGRYYLQLYSRTYNNDLSKTEKIH